MACDGRRSSPRALRHVFGAGQRPEAVAGRGDPVLGVATRLSAPVTSTAKEAGPLKLRKGGEGVAEEGVYERYVGVSEPLAHDTAVLALDHGVVVGAPGPRLGELLDVQLGEQRRDAVVDELGAVVGVESPDGEGEGGDEGFEDGDQEVLGDAGNRSEGCWNWVLLCRMDQPGDLWARDSPGRLGEELFHPVPCRLCPARGGTGTTQGSAGRRRRRSRGRRGGSLRARRGLGAELVEGPDPFGAKSHDHPSL